MHLGKWEKKEKKRRERDGYASNPSMSSNSTVTWRRSEKRKRGKERGRRKGRREGRTPPSSFCRSDRQKTGKRRRGRNKEKRRTEGRMSHFYILPIPFLLISYLGRREGKKKKKRERKKKKEEIRKE